MGVIRAIQPASQARLLAAIFILGKERNHFTKKIRGKIGTFFKLNWSISSEYFVFSFPSAAGSRLSFFYSWKNEKTSRRKSGKKQNVFQIEDNFIKRLLLAHGSWLQLHASCLKAPCSKLMPHGQENAALGQLP